MKGAALMQYGKWLLSPGPQHGNLLGASVTGVFGGTTFLCLRASGAVRAINLIASSFE